MYANVQTNLVRHNFKNQSAADFEKRPNVDERKGLIQFYIITVGDALGTTGNTCLKSPPIRKTFPPKGASTCVMS